MRGGEARKGVSGAGGYFMGYYTIWLASVKRIFGSVLGIGRTNRLVAGLASLRKFKTRSLEQQAAAPACRGASGAHQMDASSAIVALHSGQGAQGDG